MNKQNFKPKKQLFSLAILCVLIVCAFFVLYRVLRFDLPDMMRIVKTLDVRFLLLAVLCLFGYIFFSGQALSVGAKQFGYRLGFVRATLYACNDLYYSAITPSATGGQPAVAYYMSRDGIAVSTSTVILLFETACYMLGLVLLGVTFLLSHLSMILAAEKWVQILVWLGVFANVGLSVLCLLAVFWRNAVRKVAVFLIGLLARLHLLRNKEKKIENLDMHLERYASCVEIAKAHPMMLVRMFLATLAQRVCYIMIAYFVYRSFALPAYENVIEVVGIQLLLALAVNSLPLPGGVGISEIVFNWLYLHVYKTEDMMNTAILMTRGINFYLCFLICGIATFALHIYQNKKINKEIRSTKVS